jgi:hypothetical protein
VTTARRYIVCSGWYCARGRTWPDWRGGRYSRTVEFHEVWRETILRTSSPIGIFTVDSDAPIKPSPHPKEQLCSLMDNYGGEEGYLRGYQLGLEYALLNDADAFYVEQDCVVGGEWVKRTYRASQAIHDQALLAGVSRWPGCGKQLPVPIQLSLMFCPNNMLSQVIHHLQPYRGSLRSSEPTVGTLCKASIGIRHLPFGWGRLRPYDLSAPAFEIQHLQDHEVAEVVGVAGGADLRSIVEGHMKDPSSWRG